MTEYKFGNAIVRIHGDPPSREKLEPAARRFFKTVLAEIETKRKNGTFEGEFLFPSEIRAREAAKKE